MVAFQPRSCSPLSRRAVHLQAGKRGASPAPFPGEQTTRCAHAWALLPAPVGRTTAVRWRLLFSRIFCASTALGPCRGVAGQGQLLSPEFGACGTPFPPQPARVSPVP